MERILVLMYFKHCRTMCLSGKTEIFPHKILANFNKVPNFIKVSVNNVILSLKESSVGELYLKGANFLSKSGIS